jgi:hypothetical protein
LPIGSRTNSSEYYYYTALHFGRGGTNEPFSFLLSNWIEVAHHVIYLCEGKICCTTIPPLSYLACPSTCIWRARTFNFMPFLKWMNILNATWLVKNELWLKRISKVYISL